MTSWDKIFCQVSGGTGDHEPEEHRQQEERGPPQDVVRAIQPPLINTHTSTQKNEACLYELTSILTYIILTLTSFLHTLGPGFLFGHFFDTL